MKPLLFVLFALFLISCENAPSSTNLDTNSPDDSEILDDKRDITQLSFDTPSIIDSTEYLLLPIKPPVSSQNDKGLSLRSSYGKGAYHWNWNLLFFNRSTQESHLLTESKIIITSYTTYIEDSSQVLSKSILYKIRDTDYNKDGKLEHEDPEQLFISDLDGKNLQKLSPTNEHLQSYTVIPSSDQLYFSTFRDTDKNLEFTGVADEIIWYFIDLSKGTEAVEMVNAPIRQKIIDLYGEQWSDQEE